MTQPLTSILANQQMTAELKRQHYVLIINTLRKMPNGGNYEQIAKESGLSETQVSRRLKELIRLGAVYNSGDTSKTSRGRQSMIRKLKSNSNATLL